MQTLRLIMQLAGQSLSGRAIARELKLSRNTVSHYLQQMEATGRPVSALQAMDDAGLAALLYPVDTQSQTDGERHSYFCGQVPYFLAELKRTGVTRHILWTEYMAQCPDGYRYSQFCFHLKTQRNVVHPSFHNHYQPAEAMMVDFAGDMLHYIDKQTGEQIACPVLVCVLPYSSYTYVQALGSASLPYMIASLNKALRYFKGAPLCLKTDNMKQVVTRYNRYEPSFTDLMQQWSLYYNISLVAARPMHPKDKAPVENHVKIVYSRLYAPLRDKTFFSLEALNEALSEQLQQHNETNFQGKTYSRCIQFEQEERPYLKTLPDTDFELKHSTGAKVQKNYHVTLGEDWHHYSVPHSYIGQQVTAIYDIYWVEIYHKQQRIALHRRSLKRHGYTTTQEHMPPNHRHYSEQKQGWDADYFLRQAAGIGPHTQAYVTGILNSRHFTEQTFNACRGLLRLAHAYTPQRLEAACGIALPSGSYNYKTLDNILKNNLDKEPAIPDSSTFQIPLHNNIRGADTYK